MDLPLDVRRWRQALGCDARARPRGGREHGRREIRGRRHHEDGVERGHHALRILDVRRLVIAHVRHGLERPVRFRMAVRQHAVVTRLVHGVVDVRRRSQGQEAQGGDEHGAEPAVQVHGPGSVPVMAGTGN